MRKRIVNLLLCISMFVALLAGCGKDEQITTSTDKNASNSKYKEFITVDVFSDTANYQGMQTGWFGKLVKDKFNMELNIIAPNVAGGGDTLFQTRSAAGNLGDLIISDTKNGILQNIVEAGLLQDMTELLKDKDVQKNYKKAIEECDTLAEKAGIWALPSEISNQTADTPSEGIDPIFGPYIRWDLYKEVGYPSMSTLEDLIPVLEQMQKAAGTTEDGKKVYAFSFFKDWDDNLMNNVKQPTCFYGYDELGFVLAKGDGSDYQSVIDDDSEYMRVLKLFYDANQKGLVDPESTTQNYDTLSAKYTNGQVLYSPWPWLGQSLYNSPENKEAGRGFMFAPIDDMKIFSYGSYSTGNLKSVIGIGSKAKDPQRLADFIDWLYSPEGICANQSFVTGGPEGLGWQLQAGKPVLTDFGKKALPQNDVTVADEWGGGSWKDGVSALNFKAVSLEDINPETGYPYNHGVWESVLESNTTALGSDWKEQMGAETTMKYLQKSNKLLVAPGSSYIAPEDDSNISAIRSQCKASIVEYSWRLIFAKDDNEFASLKKELQETVKGLGYEDVLAADMQNAKDQAATRQEALESCK